MTSLSFFRLFFTALLLLTLSHCGKKKADDPAPKPPVQTGPTKAPTLSTDGADSLKATSALLRGTLTDAGGLTSQYGFLVSATELTPQYSATPNAAVMVLEQTPVGGISTQPFKFQATVPLKAATTYYVRAYARNSIGVGYGEVKNFKTLAEPVIAFDPPALELRPSTNLKTTAVTLNAVFTKFSNRPSTGYGFALSDTDPNPRAASTNSKPVVGPTPAGTLPFAFKLDLTDLRANTKYYVRAYAANRTNDDPVRPQTEYTETPVETFTTPPDAVASGTWKELPGPHGNALFNFYDFLYDGTLYEIDGSIGGYSLTTQKEAVNLGPAFPGTGSGGNRILLGSKAYSLMNYASSSSSGRNAEVWEYDLVAKKWTRKADFPSTPRVDGKAVVLNGKLYFGTGNEYTKARPGFATTLKDWWEYDPAADNWTQKADLPLAMYGLDGFVANGKAVLGQGNSFASGANDPTAWWEYNPQTNAWRTLKKFTGDYTTGFGWVFEQDFGGKNYALLLNQARTKYAMWAYNATTDTWTRSAELPAAVTTSDSFFGYEANGKPVLVFRTPKKVFEFTP